MRLRCGKKDLIRDRNELQRGADNVELIVIKLKKILTAFDTIEHGYDVRIIFFRFFNLSISLYADWFAHFRLLFFINIFYVFNVVRANLNILSILINAMNNILFFNFINPVDRVPRMQFNAG